MLIAVLLLARGALAAVELHCCTGRGAAVVVLALAAEARSPALSREQDAEKTTATRSGNSAAERLATEIRLKFKLTSLE